MAINPDDFIFHSDFQYNHAIVAGSTPVLSTSVGQTLYNGIKTGQRYKVVVDTGTSVIQMGGPLPTVGYSVVSGALQATSTSAGTFYFRVYDKSDNFSFLSDSIIEKAVFTAHNTVNFNGNTSITIPNTYGKKMLLFAVWKNITHAPGVWLTDGQGSDYGILGLQSTASTVMLRFGALDMYADIEYQIVGVALETDATDVYVFNSDKIPLSIPYSITKSIISSSSLTANQVKTTYSPWYDTGPGTLAMQATITAGSTSRPSVFQDIILGTNISMTISAQMNTSNQVRIVMVESNSNSSSVSYASQTATVQFDMNHIVPSGTV